MNIGGVTVRRILGAALLAGCLAVNVPARADEPRREEMAIDAAAPGRPFPHFWERMMGSGRAALSLRDSYRQDLRAVKAATGLAYVRFHAIFHDELGVYAEDGVGKPVFNFQYVDQVYDGLLAAGVRPFVELGFMPRALAARLDYHPFWYRPVVSPPRRYAAWDRLIDAFARHLVERYGLDEVAQWYFEVWNEPNLDFWTGRPAQTTYFELYDHTAKALKQVSPRLRVGGPATAQAAWVDAMIAHAAKAQVPLDFVSTHFYGDDKPVAGGVPSGPHGAVCAAVRKVRDEIAASAMPHLPLFISEFNATFKAGEPILISPFMGPLLADTISRCDGLAEMMSYWTFSDVFEEQGVIRGPFLGGYGLIGVDGIRKPAFAAFAALHRLGEERLPVEAENVLATRRSDGRLIVAVWNGPDKEAVSEVPPPPLDVILTLRGIDPEASGSIVRVDAGHGDALGLFREMDSPTYPNASQIEALRQAGEPGPPASVKLTGSRLDLQIPRNGLAVIEIKPRQ